MKELINELRALSESETMSAEDIIEICNNTDSYGLPEDLTDEEKVVGTRTLETGDVVNTLSYAKYVGVTTEEHYVEILKNALNLYISTEVPYFVQEYLDVNGMAENILRDTLMVNELQEYLDISDLEIVKHNGKYYAVFNV